MTPLRDVLSHVSSPYVVIAMINGIGDGFLALPVIRYIVALAGESRVTVWALPAFSRTCFAELGDILLPTIAERRYDTSFKEQEVSAIRERIPHGSLICWVSLNSYHPLTEIEQYALASLAPQFTWSFNVVGIRSDASKQPVHRGDQYFRVIGEGTPPPNMNRRPRPDSRREPWARHVRTRARAVGKALVAIHAETTPKKQWPVEHWMRLAALLERYAQLVVLGTPQPELARGPGCMQQVWSWDEQVALLSIADAFIGIDSCFAHVADACNIPGATLYGSENSSIEAWLPRNGLLRPMFAPRGELMHLQPDDVADVVFPYCEARAKM